MLSSQAPTLHTGAATEKLAVPDAYVSANCGRALHALRSRVILIHSSIGSSQLTALITHRSARSLTGSTPSTASNLSAAPCVAGANRVRLSNRKMRAWVRPRTCAKLQTKSPRRTMGTGESHDSAQDDGAIRTELRDLNSSAGKARF